MANKSVRKMLGLALLCTALFGCATSTTQAISNSDKVKVASVNLNEQVPYPSQMYYIGPGGATGLMFGAIGGLLAAPGIEKERQTAQAQTSGGTSIDRIVYEETLAQLRASGKFAISERPIAGGATMHVSVTQYGFSIPNGFSSRLVPILRIQLELRDAAGHMLWTGSSRTLTLGNPVESVDAEESTGKRDCLAASSEGLGKNARGELLTC
jgi:hypothetical protein